METIRMADLHTQYLRIKEEIDQAIQEVLDSTAFIQGPQVKQFADALGTFLDSKAVIPCANGTDALQIAMMALGCKVGDEVILPVYTYVATAEVIALLGLKPVFVDVDRNDFNIDVNQIEGKITERTFAIVPVHLYGQCANMESILSIAKKHHIHVIEDAAQSLGAVYTFSDGQKLRAGTMGVIGCTSFFPSKNLGCFGDGGAIFTQDKSLAENIKMIANHGQKVKYYHDRIGVNSRLDTLQAAILQVKLKYLTDYETRRRRVADFYDLTLSSISFLETPFRSSNSTHVFHQYTLKTKGIDRDQFRLYLEEREIPTMIYYPVPLHLQKAYASSDYPFGSFKVTEELSRTVISLPIHTEMTDDQLSYICSAIKEFAKHA
ncbi:MAG: DegT/DnrJ/EryC1/StrS family aminotransferase [Cyclobacteriaceae bacterium]|nr:DegT/DnrJ/EryC1/StrS family aminotransferase [Cyclobacteriaceae bacterium]